MRKSVITFSNASDDDRDQVVFCAEGTDPARPPLAWRVVGPLPQRGFARFAVEPPQLEVTWDGGATGLRCDAPFGAFAVGVTGGVLALCRIGRGSRGRFELSSEVSVRGGIVARLVSDERVLVASAPIARAQRIVLAVPRNLRVLLCRGARDQAPVAAATIVGDLGTIDAAGGAVELRGSLAEGYWLRPMPEGLR